MTGTFEYDKDADGIVTVTMNMSGPVNAMNDEYEQLMGDAVSKLEAEEGLKGVVLASAKKVFFAGGDLNSLLAVGPEDAERFFQSAEQIKSQLRRLEKLPVPVVAAINGAALGGGFEICLACNHRIAWDDRSVQIGLPEVSLGLLPGGGGVVRMVNLLGLEAASPFLLEGKKVSPDQALSAGLIHATVDSADELVPAAKAWLKDNPDEHTQPWDQKGHKIPGGNASSPKLAQFMVGAPTMLSQKTRGLMPAPVEILDVAVNAARLDFDTALTVESRGLTKLALTPEAKNMITTFFFQLNRINSGASRPKDVPRKQVKKLGILGAGMMGQGIAYVSAKAGMDVVLKDISVEAAEKGKAYSETLLDKAIKRGRSTEDKKQALLDRIHPTASNDDLAGCDLIIEAVFENIELKNKILRETESQLADGGVWGSNTSTLPITQLAEASEKPDNFIGIHFFSPVDKMPLVEIIRGDKTSDETLALAFDYTQQIKKTPIVVNDSLGFFTSRTFGTYLDEGARLVHEGLHPLRVDNLGKAVGFPVGPLTVHDEVSQELTRKANETWAEMGVTDQWGDGSIMREMIDFLVVQNGRGGRHHNGGYFDYNEAGKTLWPGLLDRFHKADHNIPDQDIKDRLLFRQVIETLKCLQTGVLRTVADGNIGSIMGIGAPAHTGGYLQFINTYGLQRFADRCAELEAAYGERFSCPQIVQDKISADETFA
ncbi:MAG: 3-hydroxyacyl-CoA dehydrogenase [Salinisphaeraceae bacterium]|nr:3-hydroxyacyl-CoA dehydrogenase [Salinisphaeraceae bacterium]